MRTLSIADRNRAIKKALEAHFGRGKVRVRGDRGTAYGWVNVKIDVTPLDMDETRDLRTQVWKVIAAANLDKEIGTYGYDDPGSDYGHGSEILIDFNPAKYFRTHKHEDGSLSVLRDGYNGEWEHVAKEDL